MQAAVGPRCRGVRRRAVRSIRARLLGGVPSAAPRRGAASSAAVRRCQRTGRCPGAAPASGTSRRRTASRRRGRRRCPSVDGRGPRPTRRAARPPPRPPRAAAVASCAGRAVARASVGRSPRARSSGQLAAMAAWSTLPLRRPRHAVELDDDTPRRAARRRPRRRRAPVSWSAGDSGRADGRPRPRPGPRRRRRSRSTPASRRPASTRVEVDAQPEDLGDAAEPADDLEPVGRTTDEVTGPQLVDLAAAGQVGRALGVPSITLSPRKTSSPTAAVDRRTEPRTVPSRLARTASARRPSRRARSTLGEAGPRRSRPGPGRPAGRVARTRSGGSTAIRAVASVAPYMRKRSKPRRCPSSAYRVAVAAGRAGRRRRSGSAATGRSSVREAGAVEQVEGVGHAGEGA